MQGIAEWWSGGGASQLWELWSESWWGRLPLRGWAPHFSPSSNQILIRLWCYMLSYNTRYLAQQLYQSRKYVIQEEKNIPITFLIWQSLHSGTYSSETRWKLRETSVPHRQRNKVVWLFLISFGAWPTHSVSYSSQWGTPLRQIR